MNNNEYKDSDVTEKTVYKYYSTQRPVDIGTFPKTDRNPIQIVNFNKRQSVELGRFQAWGYLVYDAPLTGKQIDDYELRAAPDKTDVKKRMQEISQVVGRWEEAEKIPDILRLTSKNPDSGSFSKKDSVTSEQMEKYYKYATKDWNRIEKSGLPIG